LLNGLGVLGKLVRLSEQGASPGDGPAASSSSGGLAGQPVKVMSLAALSTIPRSIRSTALLHRSVSLNLPMARRLFASKIAKEVDDDSFADSIKSGRVLVDFYAGTPLEANG